MEKYFRVTEYHSPALVRVLTIFGMIIGIIFGSWSLGSGSTFAVSSSPLPSTNLPSVKIMSPHNGQQIPVGSHLVVSGLSSPPPADTKRTYCTVSLLLNAVKPYQKAVATGHGGTTDFSTWRYGITPDYATIKGGQNKITAKISCAANPANLTKFNSLNVTGIGTAHSVNGQNGKNGTNGANGISSGGNGGSANGGNGGSANGGNGGSANGGNGGSANGGNGGSANGGKGGNGGNGGKGGSAVAGNRGSAFGGNGGDGGSGGDSGNAN
jgi:hypothetical protein